MLNLLYILFGPSGLISFLLASYLASYLAPPASYLAPPAPPASLGQAPSCPRPGHFKSGSGSLWVHAWFWAKAGPRRPSPAPRLLLPIYHNAITREFNEPDGMALQLVYWAGNRYKSRGAPAGVFPRPPRSRVGPGSDPKLTISGPPPPKH